MIPENVQTQIDELKQLGFVVQAITIAGTKFIYRSVNRGEFRRLQEALTREAEEAKKTLKEDELEQAALQIRDRGEDRLLNLGLIYPAISENTPAGALSTLADLIMQASGFGVETEPETL